MDQNTVAKFKNVWNEQYEQASVTEPSQPVAVLRFKPGSQYFACVALRPKVDVNACCNTRIKILFLHCVVLQHVSKLIYMHFWLQCDTSKIL